MAGRLQGKTAVVTAAGQGMGHATALAFAREGASVVATDIDLGKLTALDGVAGVETRALDVLDPAAIRDFAASMVAPDILFNCAGYVHNGTILDCDEDAFDFSVSLNVRSMYRMIRAFLPGMLDRGGASIVNMASVASTVIAAPNRFIYGTTKAAVIGLTKSLGKELATTEIRVNAVTPAAVKTEIFAQMTQAHIDFMLSKIPVGRFGLVEEVASLVCWLGSRECSFSTGAVFDVSGGRATY